MIYSIEGFLRSLGWNYVGQTSMHAVYERQGEYMTFPLPDASCAEPEVLVNGALDHLGVDGPRCTTFWCG